MGLLQWLFCTSHSPLQSRVRITVAAVAREEAKGFVFEGEFTTCQLLPPCILCMLQLFPWKEICHRERGKDLMRRRLPKDFWLCLRRSYQMMGIRVHRIAVLDNNHGSGFGTIHSILFFSWQDILCVHKFVRRQIKQFGNAHTQMVWAEEWKRTQIMPKNIMYIPWSINNCLCMPLSISHWPHCHLLIPNGF